jgi:hypothetical protein
VVARDRDHLGPGAGQPHERADHQLLRLRRWRRRVVEVARDEHRVDLLLPRDADDLAEHLLLLVEARMALERLADVPVGRMKQSHQVVIVGTGSVRSRSATPTGADGHDRWPRAVAGRPARRARRGPAPGPGLERA